MGLNVERHDARTRIAHLLCEMAVRSGVRPLRGEVTYSLPVTQTHLADATGLASVHGAGRSWTVHAAPAVERERQRLRLDA